MKQPPVKRVLVVDDNELLLNTLVRSLALAGFEVVAHGTFEQARQALASERFDAVVTDVRLGDFNGLQLAVVSRTTNPDIRIIVFSGYDDPVLREEAESVGATFLLKPVPGSEFVRLLSEQRDSLPQTGASEAVPRWARQA